MNSQVSKLNRFVGVFIDSLVASIPYIILTVIAGIIKLPILAIVGYVLYLLIFLLRDALFGGQSIGKKTMKYKVVKADGTSLAGDYKTSLIRNVSMMIPLIDAIFVLTDKPRLGDGWANTKVENQ